MKPLASAARPVLAAGFSRRVKRADLFCGSRGASWAEIERVHPGQPKEQLLAWLRFIAEFKLGTTERGCAFANAAVELPDPNHPARRVIEECKRQHRELIIELCRKAGLLDPELLADELFLLGEGARVSMQSLGPRGPAERLAEMFQTLVAAHTPAGS